MALVKCTECENEISNTAKLCPKCGAKNKRRKTTLFTWFVTIFIAIPVIIAIATPNANTPKTPEEIRQDEAVRKAVTGAGLLKQAMRDPDGFKLETATVVDGSGAACYQYRAKNGFGGINAGMAVLAPDGTFKTDEMPGFDKVWGKECAGKQGQDVAAAINMFGN